MLSRARLVSLCRARDGLRALDDASPSVHALAADVGISTGAFIRSFASVFGETPHQYRIRARLERAKQLLAIDDGSVTEVCFAVGFQSLGSFSSLFARRIGVPPSLYRRRMRAQVQVPASLSAVVTPGCLDLMGEAFRRSGARAAAAISEKRRPAGEGTLASP